MSFERANIHTLHGYVPGEQPDSAGVIKLNTNENPYPPSAAVTAALASIQPEELRRYPSPTATGFRQAVAAMHGLLSDNVIATNGGDELLRLAITTFAGPGETVGIANPGYSLYPVLAAIQGCSLKAVELDQNWQLPRDFAAILNRANARLALLVNPHAPSGALASADTIAGIAEEFEGVLLVDEAYVDFVDPDLGYDLVKRLHSLDNLLLLRTLSKGYSLAGLRFGYGLGSATLVAPMLYKTRDSYNTDAVAQKLARAAIDSVDEARLNCARVREERGRLHDALTAIGWTVLPSQTNFLLAGVTGPLSAAAIYAELKARNILVRYFDQDRLRDKLRITVGTPEQNRQLVIALGNILTP